VADHLVWWTRAVPEDGDHFINADEYKPRRFTLPTRNYRYPTGTILELPFFKWENLLLLGSPPEGAAAYESDFRAFLMFDDQKQLAVEPAFYHKSGPLELVWFSDGFPVWRKEYDIASRLFGKVRFLKPNNLGLVKVEQQGGLVALLLRARFQSQTTWEAAMGKLESLAPR
jgi:hypothetical protein